jgi:hypothetical protein
VAGDPLEGRQKLWVGDGLYVALVPVSALREQPVNAQVLMPRHFERLAENIRQRGQVESIPYCYRPGDEGPVEIISGHHRYRAGRAAGLEDIPCLIDIVAMRPSQVTAKVIAHNEIHGTPDEAILAQMVATIDNVDDLLATGLPEDKLPVPPNESVTLGLPHASFDWKLVTMLFLPHQLADFESAMESIDKHSELIGIAPRADWEDFARQVLGFGRAKNIRSVATTVAALIQAARREAETAAAGGEWKQAGEVVGPLIPAGAAEVIGEAIARVTQAGDAPAEQPWLALERICADWLAGA